MAYTEFHKSFLSHDMILSLRSVRVEIPNEVRETVIYYHLRRRGCRSGKHIHDDNNRPNQMLCSVSRSLSHASLQETSAVAALSVTWDKPQHSDFLPVLYVLNAASIVKPHAIEQLSAELNGYSVDVSVISETHLKKKHADSVVQIAGYSMFRRDRRGRKGGGVAIYTRCSIDAIEWKPVPDADPLFEMLWVRVVHGSGTTFIGALYHPPAPKYRTSDLLDHIEEAVVQIQQDFPQARVILAGDLNTLPDNEVIIRTGLSSIVMQPTRGNSRLDRVYVSGAQYRDVRVVRSAVKSDHMAIVAFSGNSGSAVVKKSRRVCKFRKHTSAQHAHFLASVSAPVHIVNLDRQDDPQGEFDHLYTQLRQLLDAYYPEQSVTITTSDPPFVTPVVKRMLRKKNALMRSGKVEKAAALSKKIGDAIKKHNTAEFSNVDVLSDSKNIWAKVRQLTGRSKATIDENLNSVVTADLLNKHYACISTDDEYKAPRYKRTVNTQSVSELVTEWRVFKMLEALRPTATGLDGLPSWFLKVGAPFFAAPIADMFNLSLSSSTVPKQWKAASITPVPKIPKPLTPSDYRPISITPVLSRVMERIIVRDHIYQSLQCPPPGLIFDDQFAFRPTGSTTAALIKLIHEVTAMLELNPYVIVYAIDFSKAFDTVRHSELLDKYSRMELPDCVYNWLVDFFRDHSHCTRFRDMESKFIGISASIIQGSAAGPASYVVTSSDLRPLTVGNSMVKFADDTYLVIPASNCGSCAEEINHVGDWASSNNLRLNHAKSMEIVFVSPRSRRAVVIPAPAVPDIPRVDKIKALGVTLSRRFSVSQHVDQLLISCSQSLFALRTLRHHGLPTDALHAVFQATVVSKLAYASPAWWGFTSAADRDRLEAFLRRSATLGYRSTTAPTLSAICSEADDKLFEKITSNSSHLLHHLLPPRRDTQYSLRPRAHHFTLPTRTTSLKDKNYFNRIIYKNIGCQ